MQKKVIGWQSVVLLNSIKAGKLWEHAGQLSRILILLGTHSDSLGSPLVLFTTTVLCRSLQDDQEHCASDLPPSFLIWGSTDILGRMLVDLHYIANLSVGAPAPLELCLTVKVISAPFSSPLGGFALRHFVGPLRRC